MLSHLPAPNLLEATCGRKQALASRGGPHLRVPSWGHGNLHGASKVLWLLFNSPIWKQRVRKTRAPMQKPHLLYVCNPLPAIGNPLLWVSHPF